MNVRVSPIIIIDRPPLWGFARLSDGRRSVMARCRLHANSMEQLLKLAVVDRSKQPVCVLTDHYHIVIDLRGESVHLRMTSETRWSFGWELAGREDASLTET